MTSLNSDLEYQSSFNCLLNWTVSENGEKEVIRPEKLLKTKKSYIYNFVVEIFFQ